MTNSNEDTILFLPRFPYSVGGRPILFLRVIKSEGKSFKTVELCYNFLLEEEYKRYKILNIETNKIVESYPN